MPRKTGPIFLMITVDKTSWTCSYKIGLRNHLFGQTLKLLDRKKEIKIRICRSGLLSIIQLLNISKISSTG